MIELPESHALAACMNEAVRGKVIKEVKAGLTPHGFAFFYGNKEDYPALLEGKTVGESRAWGGYLETDAEDAVIRFNDGVNVRYYEAGAKLPAKHQMYIGFEDGSCIVCTIQMYGGISVSKAGEDQNPYYLTARRKPTPLTDAFDEAYFLQMYEEAKNKKKNMSAKAFLATEQRIPGLGNGVLQDILFEAGLHPKARLENLTDEDLDSLYRSIKQVLLRMTQQGGRDTEKTLFGQYGGYMTILSKKTLEEPCPVCGGMISRQAYLGGNVYFCPRCQEMK